MTWVTNSLNPCYSRRRSPLARVSYPRPMTDYNINEAAGRSR